MKTLNVMIPSGRANKIKGNATVGFDLAKEDGGKKLSPEMLGQKRILRRGLTLLRHVCGAGTSTGFALGLTY